CQLCWRNNSWLYRWKADNYWKAGKFWRMTLKEGYSYCLGTFRPSAALLNFLEFYNWIHDPLDQRNCAASWAFSTASAAADRIAIHSQGRFTDNLSPQNLISCVIKNQQGCKGGSISNAWLVSHACYPLFWSQLHPMICAITSVFDAEGKRQATKPCPNQFETSNHIYQSGSPYRISSKVSVQSIMKVYNDLFLYKSGIYKHTSGEPQFEHQERLHSVKLVGTGLPGGRILISLNDIFPLSWGISWGENGYFRILRGQNECDIEKLIIAIKCHL
uniref:Tubulointerstitial nephritis antigen n=1 Tax=Laticauda laticaudata TaxID=8630 RepID=A0A8C5T020_LATLA